jgi:beta-N-acetylhexosaminidase
MQTTVSPYAPAEHEHQVYELWQQVLGDIWPISPDQFHQVTIANHWYKDGDHLIAEVGGTIAGFVATQISPHMGVGEIMLIMVAPQYQRRGIGKTLLNAATQHCLDQQVRTIQIGGGGLTYFWPGVPQNLPGAIAFFESCGWNYSEVSDDLVGDLTTFQTPDVISQHFVATATTLHIADEQTASDVLTFEQQRFPQWSEFYSIKIEAGDFQDIVYARNCAKEVVGAILLSSPHSKLKGQGFNWSLLLGDDMGTLDAVGVAESVRRQGVGLTMVAKGCQILQQRGVQHCHIGWTGIAGWYGKLGFEIWRGFSMSWREC